MLYCLVDVLQFNLRNKWNRYLVVEEALLDQFPLLNCFWHTHQISADQASSSFTNAKVFSPLWSFIPMVLAVLLRNSPEIIFCSSMPLEQMVLWIPQPSVRHTRVQNLISSYGCGCTLGCVNPYGSRKNTDHYYLGSQ